MAILSLSDKKGLPVTQPKRFEKAILLRLPPGTGDKLKEAANRYQQSVSDYVRQVIRVALERDGSGLR